MIEEELFENAKYEEAKLLKYGFQKENNQFTFKTTLYQDEFDCIITVNDKVKGKLIERCSNEEYFNFRLQNVEGTFVNNVKEEYQNLLIDIKNHCFQYEEKRNYWVIPANTKHYDVIAHFKNYDTITWRQSVNVELHDFVYIYIGVPIKAILFKCEAIQINFKGEHENTMELKLLEQYEETKYPFSLLKEYDLKAIRGARKVPEKTIQLLNERTII